MCQQVIDRLYVCMLYIFKTNRDIMDACDNEDGKRLEEILIDKLVEKKKSAMVHTWRRFGLYREGMETDYHDHIRDIVINENDMQGIVQRLNLYQS